MPHPSPRVFHIPRIARDEVDMHMRHSLSRCRANVDAHVESVGVKAFDEQAFQPVNHQPKGSFGVGGKGEVIGDVLLGNDQRMAGRDGVFIQNCVAGADSVSNSRSASGAQKGQFCGFGWRIWCFFTGGQGSN